ncbi:MAG: M48 family metallopeptidase [Chloroflexi bacterium]|nr:M48 family metallopeptidase [Chloroflexota bacterium]
MVRTARCTSTFVGPGKTRLDGQIISYTIKRSATAKHVRLEVRSETGLTVVIPQSHNIRQITHLLKAKKGWILSKLAKYGQLESHTTEKQLRSGDTISYLGRDLELVVRHNHGNADSARLEWDRLVVSLRDGRGRPGLVLEQWYRVQAARLIKGKADKLSARLGLTYNRLMIRGQRTRWGSCSQKGNLSFNWKLIMAPEPVMDYVIVHELAHLKEMNHTKRFWELVGKHCPQWRDHRKWLKEHGFELAAALSD